jgi:hypothetical protein
MLSGRGIDFIHSGPEPHGTVPDGWLGGIHSLDFEAGQSLAPTLHGLAHPVLDSQEPLLATGRDPNNHKVIPPFLTWCGRMRIPEHSAGHSDNIRPPKPGYSATLV